MKDTLLKIANFISRMNETIGKTISWLTLVLVLLVCFDVIRRFLFNQTEAWIMEMEWHLFALIFLLGAGYTLKNEKHVRVDLFYHDFEGKDKALVNLIGTLVFLMPMCLVLIYVGFYYAYESYSIGEGSPDPGGLPYRYLIKSMIPVGMIFLVLQGVSLAIQSYFGFLQNEKTP